MKEEGVSNMPDAAGRSGKIRTQMCPLELAKLLVASERGFSGVVGPKTRLQRAEAFAREKRGGGDREGHFSLEAFE